MPRVPGTAGAVVVLVLLLAGTGSPVAVADGPELELSVRVNGEPFTVGERVPLSPGDTVRLEFTVTNAGSSESDPYTVWTDGKKDEEWPILGQDLANLDPVSAPGRGGLRCERRDCLLEPGESVTVSYTMRVPDGSRGEYGVRVTLELEGGGGRSVMIPMPVSPPDEEVRTAVPAVSTGEEDGFLDESRSERLRIVAIVVTVISIFVGVIQILT